MSSPVIVRLWGLRIGALSYRPDDTVTAVFEYSPEFVGSGIEPAPLAMPLQPGTFSFPDISMNTFNGLPGMLADSLPDRFGNQLIDSYLASKGIPPERITAIDRLHFVGERGMGALEYLPADDLGSEPGAQRRGGVLDLAELTELANLVLSRNDVLSEQLERASGRQAAFDLLRVGSSAGGARAKALIALDAEGNPGLGHLNHGLDHSYWILKFDGIGENRDRESVDPPGSTVLEYIYSLIARNCDITMPRSRLLDDGSYRHFMIERFDRVARNGRLDKVHYSSWCGMAHADRDRIGAYSYEQLVLAMRQIGLPQVDIAELYRRAVFNIVGRNHDDHTKNFGFLMDRNGRWRLAPAFDLTYAYDPYGRWTSRHQISLNGKGENFSREDLLAFGTTCNLSHREAGIVIERTLSAFSDFGSLARQYELPPVLQNTVERELLLKI